MTYQTLEVTERHGAAWITLNRPDALNSINGELIEELIDAIDSLMRQRPVAIVLTGRGRAFCTGADLKWAHAAFSGGLNSDTREVFDRLNRAFVTLEESPVPTIAAINGVCVAGGCEILLCVDMAVAARSAKIGDAHANYGLIPGGGSSARLPRIVGPRNAKRLLLLGEMLPADEALAMGLVNWVVPDDQLETKAEQIVQMLAAKAPEGLAKMKRLANLANRSSQEVGLEMERAVFFDHVNSSQEVKEGLAAFGAKRKPNFRGG